VHSAPSARSRRKLRRHAMHCCCCCWCNAACHQHFFWQPAALQRAPTSASVTECVSRALLFSGRPGHCQAVPVPSQHTVTVNVTAHCQYVTFTAVTVDIPEVLVQHCPCLEANCVICDHLAKSRINLDLWCSMCRRPRAASPAVCLPFAKALLSWEQAFMAVMGPTPCFRWLGL
jgi:hypothetical protein